MNFDLKKHAGGLILVLGLVFFFLSLANNNLNLALVSITSTLILWVIYGLLFDEFDVRVFAWVISSSGFLLALSVFFLYGVEEVPHPIGAIVFHTSGIAGALGISLFSLFPILILRQLNADQTAPKIEINLDTKEDPPEPVLESDDWEFVSEEELGSDEYEPI